MAKKRNRKKQLSKREYTKLRQSAYEFIVVQGLEQKEVAQLLNITEATISKWANDGQEGKWKALREARMQSSTAETDNLRKLIQNLSKQRLELEEQITNAIHAGDTKLESSLRKQASALSDEMSKQNKVLQTLDKSKYTLGVFIDVMDEIFSQLRNYDESIWEQTIDFQGTLIRKKTNELG